MQQVVFGLQGTEKALEISHSWDAMRGLLGTNEPLDDTVFVLSLQTDAVAAVASGSVISDSVENTNMEEAPEGQMQEARAEHMHDDNGGNEQGAGPKKTTRKRKQPTETDEGASAVEAFIAPANEIDSDDGDSDPDEAAAVEALIAPANDINSDDDDSDPDDHESDDMSVLWQTSFGV